ncbi:hypothetical protein [Mycoplasma seminis]|uniref:DUF31 domain-containing protein n=1 Tax=Mycoplasma seminis TaxID=512749 RepID=A0ABY9H9H1_9MOLU|nr:hypothetical protein [Mycoplasma seminis]WLP85240.1 hypothetical protein Q8852_02870 [Mycoplasma seminis]
MDFLNDSTTLYAYKIHSDDKITFTKNSINVVALDEPKELECVILNKTKISGISTDSDTFSNHLYNSFSLSIQSDFSNVLNDSNAFYFFTFEPIKEIDNFKDFYILENKIDNFQILDALENLNEITITQLDYYKEIQSMDFVIADNFETYKNNLENHRGELNIELNKMALINHISLLNSKNSYIPAQNNGVKPFLFFVNPFRVKNNISALNFWSFENYNFGLFNEYNGTLTTLENNEFVEHIKKLYGITKTIKSGYKNMTEEQIKTFKQQNGNITDLKSYSDQYLKEILDGYIYNGKFDKYLKFKSYILSASNYLISDYCWKGGNNNEYMFYTPFSLDIDPSGVHVSSRLYKKTRWVYGEPYKPESKVDSEFLNGNTFTHFGHNVQLPLLKEQLEEIDFSQNPVDFNNKTYNLNFPVYCFENREYFERLIQYSSKLPQPNSKRTQEIIFPVWLQLTYGSGQIGRVGPQLYDDEREKILSAYKQQGGTASSFGNIFQQHTQINIPISANFSYLYAKAVQGLERVKKFGNVPTDANLTKMELLTKEGYEFWKDNNTDYTSLLNKIGINDVFNPLIDQRALYDFYGMRHEVLGTATRGYAIFFVKYTYEVGDSTLFTSYFNELNNLVFYNKEQLIQKLNITTNTNDYVNINILIPANEKLKQIDIAGFWIEYLNIYKIIGKRIQINNKPYTKIIFW